MLCYGYSLQTANMDLKRIAKCITTTETSLAMYYIFQIPADLIFVLHCNWLNEIQYSRIKCLYVLIPRHMVGSRLRTPSSSMTRPDSRRNYRRVTFRNPGWILRPLDPWERKTFSRDYVWIFAIVTRIILWSGNDKRPGSQGFKKSVEIGHGSSSPLSNCTEAQ